MTSTGIRTRNGYQLQQCLKRSNDEGPQIFNIILLLVTALILHFPFVSYAATFSGSLKSVTITDSDSTNQPPTAVIDYTRDGDIFTFSASGSNDQDGNIVKYTWDFGDGATGTGVSVSHQFASSRFPVTLTVVDNSEGVTLSQIKIDTLAPLAYDHFTGTDGTLLSAHTSDSGHTWRLSGSSTLAINSNKVNTVASSNPGLYYSSFVPTDADYSVKATIQVASPFNVSPGPAGRISTSSESGYLVYWGNGSWILLKTVSGTRTTPGIYTGDEPTTAKVVTLSMTSNVIKVLINGVERIIYTDPSPISTAGRPGVGSYYADTSATKTVDDWEVIK